MMDKILLVFLCLVLAQLDTKAQNPDSTIYKQNKVKRVEIGVRLPLLIKKTDTCLYQVKEVDPAGYITSLWTDYNCMGWAQITETKFGYNSAHAVDKIVYLLDDKIQSRLVYTLDSFERPIVEQANWFEPTGSSITHTKYFGTEELPDSVHITQISEGDTVQTKLINDNRNGKPYRSEQYTMGAAKPNLHIQMKYDDEGRLIRYEQMDYTRYDNDQITKFSYNEKGELFRAEDDLNNTASEYWYFSNGLLGKAFHFNRFGDIEREEFYNYYFYE